MFSAWAASQVLSCNSKMKWDLFDIEIILVCFVERRILYCVLFALIFVHFVVNQYFNSEAVLLKYVKIFEASDISYTSRLNELFNR